MLRQGAPLRAGHRAIRRLPGHPPGGFRQALHQVVTEQFDPTDWHRYEAHGTLVTPDDVVADCGAAEGLFAFTVASRCRKVYVIEPQADYLGCIARTFAGNDRVAVIQAAVGDHEGSAYLVGEGIHAALRDAGPGDPIRVATLDSLMEGMEPKPTFLKADLEGYEIEFLRGATELIRERSPKIAITTYHRRGDAERFTAFLRGIHSDYRFATKGMEHQWGEPVMLHAWR